MRSSHTNDKIYGISISSLVANSLVATFVGVGTYMIYSTSQNDACISALIGIITSILPLVMLMFIKKWCKDKTILELNKYLFGNIIGKILNIVINITYFFSAIIVFYNMVSFFNLHFLPDTSKIYIEILLLVVISYASIQSSNVISKTSQIIFMLDIIILAVCPVGLFGQFDFSRIYPVAKNGIAPIIDGSLKYFLMSAFPIFLITIIPNTEIYNDKNNKRRLIITYFLAHICLFFIVFFTVLVLGEARLTMYRFPEYTGLKEFSLFNIIERVENALSLQFMFSMFNFVSMCVHFNTKSISKITPIQSSKKNKVIAYSLCILLLIFTNIMFKSVIESVRVIVNVFPYVVLIGIIIPMIITSLGILVKKKKMENSIS